MQKGEKMIKVLLIAKIVNQRSYNNWWLCEKNR